MKTKTVTISLDDETKDVLSRGRIDGDNYYLPDGQLPRPLYMKVDKALGALGGKWNRKLRAHVFTGDTRAELLQLLEGKLVELVDKKKTYEQFFTPEPLAERLVQILGDLRFAHVLEPSAGKGALIRAALDNGAQYVTAIEYDPDLAHALQHEFGGSLSPVDVFQADFVNCTITDRCLPPIDVVMMNPPFSNNQDIAHVLRAWEILPPGGRLVAIMSPHFSFASDKASVAFRDFIKEVGAGIEEIEEGAFKASGTNIRTMIVHATKGGA